MQTVLQVGFSNNRTRRSFCLRLSSKLKLCRSMQLSTSVWQPGREKCWMAKFQWFRTCDLTLGRRPSAYTFSCAAITYPVNTKECPPIKRSCFTIYKSLWRSTDKSHQPEFQSNVLRCFSHFISLIEMLKSSKGMLTNQHSQFDFSKWILYNRNHTSIIIILFLYSSLGINCSFTF